MKKPMSIRKIMRMLRVRTPEVEPRKALFMYQRMNEAVQALQRRIADDMRKDAANLEWRIE
jgi:hypothetical protein